LPAAMTTHRAQPTTQMLDVHGLETEPFTVWLGVEAAIPAPITYWHRLNSLSRQHLSCLSNT